MNEEEVKGRIVLPWLQSQGLAPDELFFETSFSLRIGTNTLRVGGRPAKGQQTGRLDILVRRRGTNLLVIEVKESSKTLSDSDRDQAISYARLLHPISPFALVTNGSEFQLFDAVTRDRLTSENTRFPDGGTLALPDDSRLDALRIFFGATPENVALFARAQAERVMEPLLGGADDFAAVYIPETHVERKEVKTAIESFLGATQPLFVVAGESGMGKSCLMIDAARMLADRGHPVLFFRGALLQGDILDEVAAEVEWAFGAQRGAIDTLRRLAENSGGRPLVVMVDGVDDWSFPAKVQNLVSLARQASSVNLRIIVSCKTSSWEPFTNSLGIRTGIENVTFGASRDRVFSAQAGPLSPQEFFGAVDKYRRVYRIEGGGFDPAAMREARRSPFMLRLMFQVKAAAAGTDQSQPPGDVPGRIALDSRAFFESYLRLAARRTGQEEIGISALIAIARVLYEHGEEWITEQELRRALGLRLTEQLPPALFEQRLLIGVGFPGLRRIGFGFGLLRNYIIAFHVRRWADMTPHDFAQEFAAVRPSSLRAELLSFYYPFASDEQKRAIDAPVYANALDYLKKYVALLDDFPALRDRFSPFTSGKIGFAGELRFPVRVGMFGFRPVEEHESEVLLIPSDAADNHSVRLFVAGVKQAHSYGFIDGFRSSVSIDRIRGSEIARQLESIVKKGELNESAAPELTEEAIACILTSHEFFGSFVDSKTKAVRYPVDLSEVLKVLKRELLTRHFRDEAIKAKRQRGEIKETWRDSRVSYSASLRPDETKQILARVEAALESGEKVQIRVHYTELERLELRLNRAMAARGERGTVMTAPVLPLLAELTAIRRGEDIPFNALKEHCAQVFAVVIPSYRRLVETNFPQLRNRFSSYHPKPVRAVLGLDSNSAKDDRHGFLALCESRTDSDEILVGDLEEAHLDLDANTVTFLGESQPVVSVRWAPIGEFFYGAYQHGMEYDCSGSVVRRVVYGWLREDFANVKRGLQGDT